MTAEPPDGEDVRTSDPQAWFVEADGGVADAYCLTLVKGVDVDETLRRLGADTSSSTVAGLDELVEEAYEGYEDPAGHFVGAAEIGEWTLLVEPNGFGGTRKKRMKKVSKATTAVTIYCNVNLDNEFVVWENGGRALSFDMMFAEDRWGDDAARFDDDLLAAGYVLEAPNQDDEDDEDGALEWAISGARLVERLTGVRLTIGLLDDLRYRTARLPSP